MNDHEYILSEIATAERDHDPLYKVSIKFSGSKHSSRNVDLTKQQLEAIKAIFAGVGQ